MHKKGSPPMVQRFVIVVLVDFSPDAVHVPSNEFQSNSEQTAKWIGSTSLLSSILHPSVSSVEARH